MEVAEIKNKYLSPQMGVCTLQIGNQRNDLEGKNSSRAVAGAIMLLFSNAFIF
jgi:hypothetical protein